MMQGNNNNASNQDSNQDSNHNDNSNSNQKTTKPAREAMSLRLTSMIQFHSDDKTNPAEAGVLLTDFCVRPVKCCRPLTCYRYIPF